MGAHFVYVANIQMSCIFHILQQVYCIRMYQLIP